MKTRVVLAILIGTLIFGCTTATTPAASQSAAQTAGPANPEFKNLQVLPRDLTRDQLMNIMRSFTRGLGVRCNHCHQVVATEPEEKLDFPSDAKEEKRVARVMIQMTQQINGAWLQRVEEAEGHHEEATATPAQPGQMRVVCWTCHRGKTEPEMPPPPQPRPAA